MKKLAKGSLVLAVLLMHSMSYAKTLQANSDQSISVKLSKSGLNRISNPPYQIVQVTGDDSQYGGLSVNLRFFRNCPSII